SRVALAIWPGYQWIFLPPMPLISLILPLLVRLFSLFSIRQTKAFFKKKRRLQAACSSFVFS
ncbi:MAG: hypothetical protein PHC72_00005, partial [Eubacteriales bacterium]|nr:hypothetical protein [Eubacteriales bacterium]